MGTVPEATVDLGCRYGWCSSGDEAIHDRVRLVVATQPMYVTNGIESPVLNT